MTVVLGDALVCGGGLAGLSSAAALAQRGWNVELLERDDALREIGGGIYLKQNALLALKDLGILDDVRKNGVKLRGMQTYDGAMRPMRRGDLGVFQREPVYTIPRRALHRALARAADEAGVKITTSVTVERATPDGRVVLDGGTTRRADLVVAADGVNSKIRQHLGLTRFTARLPEGATRLLIPRGQSRSETECWSVEFWAGSCRMLVTPCSEDATYLCLMGPEGSEQCRSVPIVPDYWSEHFPAVAAMLDKARDAEATRHRLSYVECRSWVRGRVALLGDAAHGQPPSLAQGAGVSFSNATWLADAVSKTASNRSVPEALQTWQARRRPVGLTVQRVSLAYAMTAGYWPVKLSRARPQVMAFLLRHKPLSGIWDFAWRGGMRLRDDVDFEAS